MLQSHLTTTEQSGQTTPLPFIVSSETAPLSETAEMNLAQQEQADSVARLLTTLERDTQKRQKWSKRIAIGAAALFVTLLIVALAGEYTGHKISYGIVQLANVFNFCSYAVAKFFLNRNAALELTKVDDVRCVGALVDV